MGREADRADPDGHDPGLTAGERRAKSKRDAAPRRHRAEIAGTGSGNEGRPLCGGLGVRMGEQTQRIPKPMITVGEPADPLAHHEVLRVVGAHRLHPLPRIQGRGRSRSTSSPTTRRSPTTSCSRTAAATSSCSAPTSRIGGSRSSTPDRSRRSASACAPSRPISATTSTSSPRTATASPTHRCPT